jgi:tetratricopeptide (TPR) repeat protein
VHRQTEGNPLFVQEVIRYLAEEGLITRKEGLWRPTKDAPLEMSIPEGLRDVIGKRLSLLSPDCNQLLAVASVIGREFALETLKAVAGINEDVFVSGLKEAVRLSILEERSQRGLVRYRFTHAFFRQTLYEEVIAPRRIRLHQQVARALEALYAKRLEEHAAELAEHFSHSSDPADLKKAVEYGEMAAKRATNVYAYGEAVRLLEQALRVQEVLDPEDKARRCDLLLALGDALLLAGEHQRVVSTEAPQAFSLAEAVDHTQRASRSCMLAMKGLVAYGTIMLPSPEGVYWAARADRYAEPETVDRAWADCMLAHAKLSGGGSPREATPLLRRALDLARRLGDPDTYWWIAGFWLQFADIRHDQERLRLAEALMEESRHGVNLLTLAWALWFIVQTFLEFGQRQRAEEVMAEMKTLAERTGQPNLLVLSMVNDAIIAIWDGGLEEAMAMRRHILARAEELGILEFALVWTSWLLPARVHLGKADRALEANLEGSRNRPHNVATNVMIGFCLAHLGRSAELAEILERPFAASPGVGWWAEDEYATSLATVILQGAVMGGHRQVVELLLHGLAGRSAHTSGLWHTTCTGRHLGAAAALLGRPDEARKYYQEAIKACTEMSFRPELALSRLQLAELLLEHYPDEKKEALEHLDFAIKEFQDMKMRPSLERALRHKDILKA